MRKLLCLLLVLAGASHSLSLLAQDVETIRPSTSQRSYSPPVGRSFPQNLYWGDTHLHTNISNDAFA